MRRQIHLLLLACLLSIGAAIAQSPDWSKVDGETLQHFRALLQIDTANPPGNETRAVDYLKQVLEREGIPSQTFALEPSRGNLVARIKGSGKKRPLLIMGHTDVVTVDLKKWKFGPFSAAQDGGYIYGRGAVDDKDNLVACLMITLLLKRLNLPLDRDVIFLAEAGEEGSTRIGINFMIEKHFDQIDAEYAIAEGGGVTRQGGRISHASVGTAEKVPYNVKLVARGPAGHGSIPRRSNAVVHLSQAVAKVAAWQTPMRLNDTTREYFERLAAISPPEKAARYNGIFDPAKAGAIQEYFAENEAHHYSMLRTSISPNVISGGYRYNVIPSEAEARLDVRVAPGEDMDRLLDEMKRVINDPAVEIVNGGGSRPFSAPSPIRNEVFQAIEAAVRKHYGVVTLPAMGTGASDKAQLRAKGIASYGIGPLTDIEDATIGFGAHSDQERILEQELYRFVRYHWDLVVAIAGRQ